MEEAELESEAVEEEAIPSIVADRIATLEARNAQLLEELRRAESERRFVESELIRLQKEIKRLRVELDRLNPQIAARIATTFRSWRSFEPTRRGQAETTLRQLLETEHLSTDLGDILGRSLK